jgi:ABC-2 type transport system permease protein
MSDIAARARSIWRHARVYPWYFRANWLSLMAYPVPFAMQNLFGVIYSLGSVGAVWVLFSQIRAIGQWTFPQVMLIYGLSIFSRSLFHLYWVEIITLSGMVRNGDVDRLLVRPLNPLFQVIAGYLDNDDYGELGVSVYLMWTSLGILGQRTWPNLLWLLVAGFSGSIIFASVHIVTNATAFFTVETRGITGLAWAMDEFTRYPADMYGKGVRTLITWLVPVAFASFYPAQLVFGEGRMAAIAKLTPLVAAATFAAANRFWRWAIDRYQGVGH